MKRGTLPILLLVATLASCTIDGYDTGDGTLSYLKAEYCDMTIAEHRVKSIITDADESLPFQPSLAVSSSIPADTMLRRLLYYTREAGTSPITIRRMETVRVITPLQPEDLDKRWQDAVTLNGVWLSQNRKYMNISLGLLTGNDVAKEQKHSIAIVCDSVSTAGNGKIFLTLCHDQAGIPQYYTENYHFSIPMPTQDTVTVTIPTYQGIVTRTLTK